MIFSKFGVGLVRIVLRDRHLGDSVGVGPPKLLIEDRIAAQRSRVGDVELAVLAVVRVERDAEEAPLVEEGMKLDDLRLDVQERLGQEAARASMIRTWPCCSITALRPLPSGIETIAKGWVRPHGDFLQLDLDFGVGRCGGQHRGGGC